MIGAPLDVLVVGREDVGDEAELTREGLTVERSESLVAALVRLRGGGAAVAVAGSDAVGGREREAFSALRAAGAASLLAVYPPQLAWMAPRALRAGADESLVQPADPGAFGLRVARLARNAHELRRMRELASTDALTGLANRRQFDIALEREIQRAKRFDRPLTLGIFDVDHFKKYNDTCGHQAGDAALATVGSLLKSSLRGIDIVARYGGEEFAVILPETAAHPGTGVSPFPFLERIRARVEKAKFDGEEHLPGGRLTISGGIACFPSDAATHDELIAAADRALYAAKDHGRNVVIYRGAPVTE